MGRHQVRSAFDLGHEDKLGRGDEAHVKWYYEQEKQKLDLSRKVFIDLKDIQWNLDLTK